MRGASILCLLAVGAVAVVAQQSSPTTAASQLPACAASCLKQALAVTTCSPTDTKCTCTDAPYLARVEGCVLASCSIKEAMATKNVTQTSCGAPIRDRGQIYNHLTIALITISGILVATRLVYKLQLSSSDTGFGLGWDDWFILFTMLTGCASAALTVHGTVANGLGRDVWTLTPEQITNFAMFFFCMAVLYVTQVALLKASLLFFYMRIFPEPKVQRILWALFTLNAAFGVTFALLAIFQCQPVSYFWNKWDGEHSGKCLNINAITWANAAISILVDVLMLAVPMWQVWGLHLHWKKKIGVGIMFCTGTFVTIVSIIRLQTIITFANSVNSTWDNFDVSMWSSIEICVGIICACMPTLRLIIVRFFPVLSGSSRDRHYYNYRANSSGRDGARNSHFTGGRSQVTSTRTGCESSGNSGTTTPKDKSSIMLQQTFDVVYDESDEMRLVELQNVSGKNAKGASQSGREVHTTSEGK